MRGDVLHYDGVQGFGFIAGADGNRYTVSREALRRESSLDAGMPVEFTAAGEKALNVFSVREAVGQSTPVPVSQKLGETVHFGRAVVTGPAVRDGLWDYFLAGVTTNYANFGGRARRKEYWGFVLFSALIMIALTAVGIYLDSSVGNLDHSGPMIALGLVGVFLLAILIPSLAVSVRRQHDIGLSGWFFLVVFLPTVGNLILLVFALIPSQEHDNKWGPVPEGILAPPVGARSAPG